MYLLVFCILSLLPLLRVAQGTGSYPLPPQGWHLSSRLMASHVPLMGPCLMSACRAYSEQVGVKRHDGGVKGDMQR